MDLGQAHESAIKEAETDAMKRALMTFGNPFGLALYDKQQRDVTSSATAAPNANSRSRPAEVAPRQQPQSPAQQDPDPGVAPLDSGTIQQILATVWGLPLPALEGSLRPSASVFRCRPVLLLSPIGSSSGATRTGSKRFPCRTYRCALQISASPVGLPSPSPKPANPLPLPTLGLWRFPVSATIPP